jgi:tetratricopeptide (TPR) repeat protein
VDTAASLTLIPLMGPWHLRHPRWNVVTVRDALEALAPEVLWTTALPPDFDRDPSWRDTDEIALPWTVTPWAARRGTPLRGVGAPGAEEAADFERYLAAYPQARSPLDAARAALRPLNELLPQALDLPRVLNEVLPPLAAELRVRLETFGDGPGTGWRGRRARVACERIAADLRATSATDGGGAARGTVLVEADLWPALAAALDGAGIAWSPAASPPVSDDARLRSLLDVAWRGEAADVAGLIGRLRELDLAEARFLEAQLLLAHDHAAEALEVLEAAAAGDFREPYLLPGLLLARLGQLRDLAGKRDRALQAYRGALALGWVPVEARAAAEAGMRAPFALAATDEVDPT